jgi:hypothetical protein
MGPVKVEKALEDEDWVMAMQEELINFKKSSLDIGGKTQDKCNWHKVGFSQQTR